MGRVHHVRSWERLDPVPSNTTKGFVHRPWAVWPGLCEERVNNTRTMKPTATLVAFALSSALTAQTTHLLTAVDFEFLPDTLYAAQGDSLHIVFGSTDHTFTQVTEETWDANENTPSGGWNLGPGISEATIGLDGTGTIHYVCSPHASMGMKGVVIVSVENAMTDRMALMQDRFYPNPTGGQLWLREMPDGMVDLFFTDASGRDVYRTQVYGNVPVDVSELPNGSYTVRAVSSGGKELFRQRITRQ